MRQLERLSNKVKAMVLWTDLCKGVYLRPLANVCPRFYHTDHTYCHTAPCKASKDEYKGSQYNLRPRIK